MDDKKIVNTNNFVLHFLRILDIRKQVDNLLREAQNISGKMVALDNSIDAVTAAKKVGKDHFLAFTQKQIQQLQGQIYQLNEAERRRDVSVLGGTYLKKAPIYKRIELLKNHVAAVQEAL